MTLGVFLVVVIGVGALIGTQTAPGPWYAGLEKPPFNPPNWIFGPVWFTLYVLIAVAGWRTFLAAPFSAAMALWTGQMILNWAWSPAFFAAQSLWLALAIIVPMLVLILAYSVNRWRNDRVSALLFVPYAAWVSFATLLNASLIVLNT
ncbi:TspO and MBR related proteins [Pelagibacterium halotolerans]|uniref:Tryptophan-rich sensory protein n=1 Tax=Pelagibacterium halotolerans (strain DSM 22347 / JCM 15775 / CGMCC 1.7692 / B2) TaxID=1082931 RepID=G4RFW4_PELHB|nr:tryptophan-rich sensory protein [Pelagibacterium halotolerans B2]SEA02394.1 TspO and MBR related proteins [Pelagibacterium halotolerans]